MIIAVFLCLFLAASQLAADEVTKWNEIAGKASFASGLAAVNPIFESRIYAMAHAAVHDALNGIDRRYRPYAMSGRWRQAPHRKQQWQQRRTRCSRINSIS